jgi:hypothetical protein
MMADFVKQAMQKYREGDFKSAIVFFQKDIEIDDQNPKVWNALGICYSKTGQYEEALNCFENALMLDPGNVTYEKNLQKNEQKLNSTNNHRDNSQTKYTQDNESEYGFFQNYIDFIKGFILNPEHSFKKIQDRDYIETIKQLAPLIILYSFLSAILASFSNAGLFFGVLLGLIIGVILMFFVNALFVHIGILFFGKGNNNGFIRTFNAVTYALIPIFLIGWIPILGVIIGCIWGLYLTIVGLKKLHGLSTSRAILSLIGLSIIIVLLMVILAGVIAAFVFGIAGSTTTNPTNNPPPVVTSIQTSTPVITQFPTPTITVVQTEIPISNIPYDELFRYNEKHVGERVRYSGKVIQTMDDGYGTSSFRIATDGKYDDIVYAYNYKGTRILEDDKIILVGKVTGLQTYEAVLGNDITIPSIEVESISIDETSSLPKFSPGDIIADEQTNADGLHYILSYDSNTEEYHYAFIYRNDNGSWGYRYSSSDDWEDKDFIEEYYPIVVGHVDPSQVEVK